MTSSFRAYKLYSSYISCSCFQSNEIIDSPFESFMYIALARYLGQILTRKPGKKRIYCTVVFFLQAAFFYFHQTLYVQVYSIYIEVILGFMYVIICLNVTALLKLSSFTAVSSNHIMLHPGRSRGPLAP